MPALPIREAFTAETIGVYFNNYQLTSNLPPYLGSGLFPSIKKPGLELKWIKGSKGLPVALKPSNYDALATVRDRIGFKEMETEMPFFRESYIVKEKDEQEYENYMNSSDPALANEVLNNIMLQPVELINGANVVPERMIWQLLAPIDGSPKIAISANNVNYDYNYDVDGEFKANNFLELTGTDMWSDTENSDPVADIEAMQDKAEEKGVKLTVMVCSKATMNNLRDNKKIQSYISAKSTTAVVRFTKKMVQEYLYEELGITVVIYALQYKDESGVAHKFYPDITVTLLPGLESLGSTCYGKTPEERSASNSGAEVSIVGTGVAVETYTTEHPVNTHCVVAEIVLPSFERMDEVYVIKVKAA